MKNFLKKILTVSVIIFAISSVFTFLSPDSGYAASGFKGRTGNSCNFLGFTSWDCGVNIKSEATLKKGIWQIAANVATDITVAAAYLVLGYVIYGGYLYIFSGGDPGKVATGKKALYQAFLGLAIVMLAYTIMSTIRFALLGANGNLGSCVEVAADGTVDNTGASCVNATTAISGAISWFIGIAGIVSAIFVVYGGISYSTSAGDAGKLQKAKQMITYALIGLAIVALAEVITAFVTNIIQNSNKTSYINNNTTISKEVHDIKTT